MENNPNQMRDQDMEAERDEMRERGAGGTATQQDDPNTLRGTEMGEIESDEDEDDDPADDATEMGEYREEDGGSPE